ncbi:hypothetical protein ScPMuIL_008947 [Solemya velum]
MFKYDYQGGPFFEIFTPQTKDSVANWKLCSGVRKAYEKEVKSYVYSLEGTTATTKMQLPKDSKLSLTLVQRFLNFQIIVPKGQDFSIELGITDLGNNKRRLLLSTSQKETQVTPLHAKVPLAILKRGTWLNFCLDMVSLVGETWRNQTYKAIETISISANCRLRKIFTMKSQPPDNSEDEELYGCGSSNTGEIEMVPKQCQFATDVHHITQLFTMNKVRHAERLRGGDGACPGAAMEIDLNASGRKSSHTGPYHIAFGSKIPGAPSQNTSRRSTRDGNFTNRSVRSASRADDRYDGTGRDLGVSLTSADEFNFSRDAISAYNPETGSTRGGHSLHVSNMSEYLESTRLDAEEVPVVQPHPPRVPSSDRLRRRIRVKNGSGSAGKERVGSAGSSKGEDGDSSSKTGSQQSSDNAQRRRVLSDGDLLEPDSGISSGYSVDRHKSADQASRVPHVHVGEGAGPGQAARKKYNSAEYRGDGEEEGDPDDSVADVLEVLREGIDLNILMQPEVVESSESEIGEDSDSVNRLGDYEESDEDESSGKDVKDMYLFVSPPKSAPRRNISPNQHEDLQMLNKISSKGYKKTLIDSSSSRGAKPEDDFINSDQSSSEEEDLRKKKLPGSRPTSGTSAGSRPTSGASSSVASPKVSRSAHRGSPSSNKENSPVSLRSMHPAPRFGKSPENDLQRPGKSSNTLDPSLIGGGQGNMSRIERKSLREIPDPKIKSSERPYDFAKYQIEEVSESFEARMLASMQRHQDDDYEDATSSPTKMKITNNRSPRHMDNLSRHLYDSSPTTTSDDDTSFGTLKAPELNPHNYQEEMKARLSSDTLTSSNPRDWSGVYSPPIVLPRETIHGDDSPNKLSPRKSYTGINGHHTDRNNSSSQPHRQEELDLLYDPCLNCYYDPYTCKYYELA